MPHTRGVAVEVPNAYLVMSLQTSEKLQLQWISVVSVVSACGVDRPRPGGRCCILFSGTVQSGTPPSSSCIQLDRAKKVQEG